MDDYDSVVITHGGCADGTAAAHMFSLHATGKVRIYYSFNRQFDRNVGMPDLAGKNVFITDYSFPAETLLQIARVAKKLYLWDHHESAARDLGVEVVNGEFSARLEFTLIRSEGRDYVFASAKELGLEYLRSARLVEDNIGSIKAYTACQVSFVLDSKLCGAEVTYRELRRIYDNVGAQNKLYLQVSNLPPWYLQHIRDRDLWLWDKPGLKAGVDYSEHSRAFGEALFELGISESTFTALDSYGFMEIARMYERGGALMEHNARVIKSIVSKSSRVLFEGGVPAKVAQSQVMQSEIGNALLAPEEDFVPQIGIVIRYNFADCCWNVSMRGNTNSPNLSIIAKKYGGGGHAPAAGFDYVGDISKLWTLV